MGLGPLAFDMIKRNRVSRPGHSPMLPNDHATFADLQFSHLCPQRGEIHQPGRTVGMVRFGAKVLFAIGLAVQA